jgi:hypothetical protein
MRDPMIVPRSENTPQDSGEYPFDFDLDFFGKSASEILVLEELHRFGPVNKVVSSV